MSGAITNGSTAIPASGSQPVQIASNALASALLIYNNGSNTIYLGGSSVTSSTGVPLAAGAYLKVDTNDIGLLYAAGTETDTIRWVATPVFAR